MTEIKEACYKGTRILLGREKRDMVNDFIDIAMNWDCTEIQIPIIQFQETFAGKVGEENNNLMFNFTDRGDRKICLAPEYTAVIQKLASTTFKNQKDVRLFYVAECFRGEKPQAGRYRQFTQFGVEFLNPTENALETCKHMAIQMIKTVTELYSFNDEVTRGLDYYKGGKGFEISISKLGSSSQVCGGGEYDGGVGFAIGVDRLLSLK